MKTKILSLLVLALAALPALAGRVVGNLNDLTANNYSPRVTFVPLSTPLAYRSTNTVMDVERWVQPTNGLFTANLVGGLYRVTFAPPNKPILILMPPDTTNTYQFNELANLATNVGTFAFTNTLGSISQRVRPAAGSEAAFATNNPGAVDEYLTVDVGAGGGTSGALTNYDSRRVFLTNYPALTGGSNTGDFAVSGNILDATGDTAFYMANGGTQRAIKIHGFNALFAEDDDNDGSASFLRLYAPRNTVGVQLNQTYAQFFVPIHGDGSGLTALDGSAIASGLVGPQYLGVGTPDAGKFLSSTGWVWGVETGWSVQADGSWSNANTGVYITTNGHVYATAFHGDGSALSGVSGGANAITNNHSVPVNLASNLTVHSSLVVTSSTAAALLGMNSVGNGGWGTLVWNGTWTFSGAGGVTADQFTGSGAGLTGLNANTITSGTLDAARLPAGVPTSTSNNWVGSFTGNGAGLTNVTGGDPGTYVPTNNGTAFNPVLVNPIFRSPVGVVFGYISNGVFYATGFDLRNTNWVSLMRLEGTNVVAFGDPGRTNAVIYLRDGVIYFPVSNQAYEDSYGANKQAGGLMWLGRYSGSNNLAPPPNDVTGMGQPDVASIKYYRDWGNSTNVGVVLWRAPNIRIEEGHGGVVPLAAYVSIGNEDYLGSVLINYTPWPTNASATTNFYGFGHPLEFRVLGTGPSDNTRRLASPGIQSHSLPNPPTYNDGSSLMGELWLMSGVPSPTTYDATTTFDKRGNVGGIVFTNGFMTLGRFQTELRSQWADDTTIDINFNSTQFSRHRLASNTTFTVSGLFGENEFHTNWVAHRTVILDAGAAPKQLYWPAGIQWANQEGNAVPPPSLVGTQSMRIKLEAYGLGVTNIIANAVVYSNASLLDADLAAFLQRTSITDSNTIDALQYLTSSLKQSGLWSNAYAIYPMVGGTSNSHAINLRTNGYHIVYTSSGVTHNANGITGDGSTGNANTGFRFTYPGADTNCMVAIYSRSSTTTTDQARLAGVTVGTTRLCLLRNGAWLSVDGPMNNNSVVNSINTGTDLRGLLAVSKTNNNDYFVAWRTTTAASSSTANGTINDDFYLLSRSFGGSFNKADVNLAFAYLGKGIPVEAWPTFEKIVTRYQTILGRNVP